ncbi:hypothetical protein BDV18DRAFT_164619 [Aspergillus unguis]
MLAFFLLLSAATAVLAQSKSEYTYTPTVDWPYLVTPTSGETVDSDDISLEWTYTYNYTGDFTIALLPTSVTNVTDAFWTTTVPATSSSTVLPTDAIAALDGGDKTNIQLWFYTETNNGQYGAGLHSLTVSAPVDKTAVATATATGTSTTEGDKDSTTEEKEDSGSSKGAEIGIGVGVGVGGALILAAIVFFVWRRKRSRTPGRTIREISAGPGSAALLSAPRNIEGGRGPVRGVASGGAGGGGAPSSGYGYGYGYAGSSPGTNGANTLSYSVSSVSGGSGHADHYGEGRPVSVPMGLSPVTPSGSARPSPDRERFDLGG